MNFSDLSAIPGVVVDSNDPKYLGRIKCSSPGVFDTATMPVESLPWVYPFGMSNYQRMSKLINGTKIWLIKNSAQVNEYWYIPMFEYISSTRTFVSENYDNNPDVLVSRMGGTGSSLLTYDDTNGFNISIGEDYMKIKPGGEIELKASDGKIKIQGSVISTGVDGSDYEPAVMGNKLVDVMADLESAFNELQMKASSNPYTICLVDGFKSASKAVTNATKILATNTKLN